MRSFRIAEPYDTMALRRFPYRRLASHLSARLQHYRSRLSTLYDIACGTGNLSIPLARLGYRVTGLDVSEEMLALARRKAAEAGQEIKFICHDIRQPFPLPETPGASVDAITCFYHGLNFLNAEEGVRAAFEASFTALSPGGLLAFDQYSEAKMRSNFSGVKAGDYGDFFVVTQSRCDAAGQVVHVVSYFLREPDAPVIGPDLYRREDEIQLMLIYPFPQLEQWLAEAGFTVLSVESLYPQVEAAALEDVFLFLAQKPC
jgi:SAM-dependent methyltransferase